MTLISLNYLTTVRAQQATPQRVPVERDFEAGETADPKWPAASVRAKQAMVVTDERRACEVGIEILKRGGNAVDAAVAVGFALAVVLPEAGNIGGGGFMLVRMADGREAFLDYRETAPGAARRDMYLRSDGSLDAEAATLGARAVAVPGTVAGMEMALSKFGTMKLAQAMAPAIRLAAEGFPVSEKLARTLGAGRARLGQFPISKRIFLHGGALYKPGDTFRQPELARTLRRISRGGAAEFYKGVTARHLAGEVHRMGGILTTRDLADYKVKVRQPLHAKYSGNSLQTSIAGSEWEVVTAPPPSSGGIAVISALQILAPIDLKSVEDPQTVHWIAETMRRVFADRAAYLADDDFNAVPVRGLTDPRYAAERRASIDPQRASSSAEIHAGNPAPFEAPGQPVGWRQVEGASPRGALEPMRWSERELAHSDDTTHFSIVDSAGNAVANTFTLNDSFGAAITVSDGFLLNDTMDDFTTQPGTANKLFGLVQSDANAIAPGKRPVSSMTPVILLRDGKLSFVAGSPGGPRIISATLLAVLNWMRLGMDPQAAINAPRFHHQWMPDVLYVEDTLPEAVVRNLEARGHTVKVRTWIGEVEAVAIDPATGDRLGAADARREGAAMGLPAPVRWAIQTERNPKLEMRPQ
ncbi:MAG: gamma-glutamyltransferase [Acidipila sp.]|nr:gamma-glutamyltransferase [Acidipila sp.]